MLVSHATQQAARAIALDAALAEVAAAMHKRGIRPLLIKGPAVAAWLYDDPAERWYGDLDLLVDPELFDAAGDTLAGLGFRDISRGLLANERTQPESAWLRELEQPIWVDLHHQVNLIPVPPEEAWAALSAGSETLTIAGIAIDTPSLPAHLLILALHVAQHGPHQPKPIEDALRAIARVDLGTWRAATALATELAASGAMNEGLKLVPGGAELVGRLGVADNASRTARLYARSAPVTSLGIERLIAAGSVRARVGLIARELVPSPPFMRLWQPLARRGGFGLALAYMWRPWWLLAKLPLGARTWAGVALLPERRARIRPFLSGGQWALRAWLLCRAQLRRGNALAVSLPEPPTDLPGAANGVRRVLARVPASCLERSLVRQRWHAAHGRPRDVVIGVRGPAAAFGAHAWLEGDPSDPGEFEELWRLAPPLGDRSPRGPR